MTKICTQCGLPFEVYPVIDGKQRKLNEREKCTVCQPFKRPVDWNALIGKKFNKITVIDVRPKKISDPYRMCLVRCECGNTELVSVAEVTRKGPGAKKSCRKCKVRKGPPRKYYTKDEELAADRRCKDAWQDSEHGRSVTAAWRAAHELELKDKAHAYYLKNKDRIQARKTAKIAADRAAGILPPIRVYTSNVKRRQRNLNLQRAYGITLEQFNAMALSRGGRCWICNEIPGDTLHVDHDHATGAVRGLLCTKCNKGIGLLKDSPETLRKAAEYLEAHTACKQTS
jgi:hypothetical protein